MIGEGLKEGGDVPSLLTSNMAYVIGTSHTQHTNLVRK
jgi:hypothetical protein